MISATFAAMGTQVAVVVATPNRGAFDRAVAEVRDLFERIEAVCSRFRSDSELVLLNETRSRRVSADLFDLVARAVAARTETSGRFDPTILPALRAAGYDRSFAFVAGAAARHAGRDRGRHATGGPIDLDPVTRTITLADGVAIDLGGIAKGYAADRAVALVARHGPCLVDAGGDIAVSGVPETGFWPIGVETAGGPVTLALERGGVATSGRDRRRWVRADREQHHVVDPATGEPAATDLLRVTVAATSAADAEVLATSLLVAGSEAARDLADDAELPAILVTAAGETIVSEALR